MNTETRIVREHEIFNEILMRLKRLEQDYRELRRLNTTQAFTFPEDPKPKRLETVADLRRDVELLKLQVNSNSPSYPPKPKRLEMWKPDSGIAYAYIGPCGHVWKAPWNNSDTDKGSLEIGNVFNSNKLASEHLQRLGVFNRLWRLAEQCELVGDPKEEGFGFGSAEDGEDCIMEGEGSRIWPVFKTKEDAQLVLDSLSEEDRRYLRGEA